MLISDPGVDMISQHPLLLHPSFLRKLLCSSTSWLMSSSTFRFTSVSLSHALPLSISGYFPYLAFLPFVPQTNSCSPHPQRILYVALGKASYLHRTLKFHQFYNLSKGCAVDNTDVLEALGSTCSVRSNSRVNCHSAVLDCSCLPQP